MFVQKVSKLRALILFAIKKKKMKMKMERIILFWRTNKVCWQRICCLTLAFGFCLFGELKRRVRLGIWLPFCIQWSTLTLIQTNSIQFNSSKLNLIQLAICLGASRVIHFGFILHHFALSHILLSIFALCINFALIRQIFNSNTLFNSKQFCKTWTTCEKLFRSFFKI